MKDIAAEVGVTAATVSLALRNDPRISEDRRKHIQHVAREQGYKLNSSLSQIMTGVRKGDALPFQIPLAFVLFSIYPKSVSENYALKVIFNHAKVYSESRNCSVNEIFINTKTRNITPRQLSRILKARGIQGIICGCIGGKESLKRFSSLWNKIPTIFVGFYEERFQCVHSDQFLNTHTAISSILNLGYKRPGLAINIESERLLRYRQIGGFLVGQQALPERNRIPLCLFPEESSIQRIQVEEWIDTYQPDIILTYQPSMKEWLEEKNIKVPDDIALAALDLKKWHNEWAGIDPNHKLIGENAIELLIQNIATPYHGSKLAPYVVIPGTWKNGPLAPSKT